MNTAANGQGADAEMPTDLLAGLLMEMAREAKTSPARPGSAPGKVPLKIYGVMAVTTMLTFATLVSGYQLLFTQQLFA